MLGARQSAVCRQFGPANPFPSPTARPSTASPTPSSDDPLALAHRPKAINYNHLLPTRYALELEALKGSVAPETFKEVSGREDAKKAIKKVFEERYLSGKNKCVLLVTFGGVVLVPFPRWRSTRPPNPSYAEARADRVLPKHQVVLHSPQVLKGPRPLVPLSIAAKHDGLFVGVPINSTLRRSSAREGEECAMVRGLAKGYTLLGGRRWSGGRGGSR
jgi:hypothetical protein